MKLIFSEWGRQAHSNVCSVERAWYKSVDLWLCVVQATMAAWLRGDIRGKVRSLGEKHVNDICPLPGVLTQDYGSSSTHCSSPEMLMWHCEGWSALQWSVCCIAQYKGWVTVRVGGASENDAWLKITCPQRQQSIIHQPTHPSLHLNTFSCLQKILANFTRQKSGLTTYIYRNAKKNSHWTLPLFLRGPSSQMILKNNDFKMCHRKSLRSQKKTYLIWKAWICALAFQICWR